MSFDFHINDFTLSHYRKLLRLAKEKYRFITYDEIPKKGPAVLWRHDVDLDLAAALRLAGVENRMGVRATYFLLLRSPYYNLLHKDQKGIVHKLLELGHHIGLHFDAAHYRIKSPKELEKYLNQERKILCTEFNLDIHCFSFHRTNPFVLSMKKPAYAGLINVYSRNFQEKIPYCSDSYGVWRFKRLEDFLQGEKSGLIHVLTHPEWWIFRPMKPADRINRILKMKMEELFHDAVENVIYR